ncbi:hypothetical protein BDV09DRAFT_163734 [Aspergillus tetrazonus]
MKNNLQDSRPSTTKIAIHSVRSIVYHFRERISAFEQALEAPPLPVRIGIFGLEIIVAMGLVHAPCLLLSSLVP